jgi:hypothetical protein
MGGGLLITSVEIEQIYVYQHPEDGGGSSGLDDTDRDD